VKHFIIGTAGHVDHGKTALVKALTQIDCDTHDEEKKRGITINLGFAHIRLPDGNTAGIIDVPGHKDFIHTMIAGASGVDLVLLVVAADAGIMPQTLEHIEICRLLGVKKAIVALSKSDLCDEEWIELQTEEIHDLMLEKEFGSVQVLPCSTISGKGIQEISQAIQSETLKLEQRNSKGIFRMYIDRIFNPKGQGFVTTGSVLSGSLTNDETLFLLPGSKTYAIRGLQRFGHSVETLQAGDRAAIQLSGFKTEDFERGMLLSNSHIEPSTRLDALIKLSPGTKTIRRKSSVLVLSGTFLTPAKMILIGQTEAEAGQDIIVQLHLEKENIFLPEDRFIIRNSSGDQTLGGGFVMDPFPLNHRRPGKLTLAALDQLKQSFIEKDKQFLRFKFELEKGLLPVKLNENSTENAKLILDELNARSPEDMGILYDAASGLLAPSVWVDRQKAIILSALSEYHQKNYLLDDGLTIAELAGKCGIKTKTLEYETLFYLLQTLECQQVLKLLKNFWQLYSYQPKVDKKDMENLNELEHVFIQYQMNKPVMEEVEQFARTKGINKDKLYLYLSYMVQQGTLYQIEKDYLHAKLVNKSRSLLINELKRIGKGINEGEFRILIDGTKKIVHPLISLFIKEGIIKQDIYIINITELGLKS
jgi:selenocysteine-specific elongation factor